MKKGWAFALVVMFLGVFAAVAANAKETNYWIGPSGGSWGTDANWSLEHVPTADEYVDYNGTTPMTIVVDGDYVCWCFYVNTSNTKAPLTFTGSGSITASGSNGHYSKKPLILDGVTLALNGRETLFYASVTLKNGAKLTSDRQKLHSWASKAEFLVEDGEISCGPICYASTPSSVTLKKGKVTCTALQESSRDQSGRCNVTIEGGDFNCSGEFLLTNATTLAMSGGALTIGGRAKVMDTATLSLTGGAITNTATLTASGKRLVTESKGTSFTAASSGTAVDFIEEQDETVVFPAPFSMPNGQFITEKRATLVSDQPMEVYQFAFGPASTAETSPLTLQLKTIVARGQALFATKTGNARTHIVKGETTIRPTTDIPSSSGTSTYPMFDGTVIVDTRDWNDESVPHDMYFRNVGSCDGNGSLSVRGGGTVSMTHSTCYYPFRTVTVESGTTLVLREHANVDYGSLCAEKIVLGPNAVLKIPGGLATARANAWEVDPTARIEVTVVDGMVAGGQTVLRGLEGLPAGLLSQVSIVGEGTAGWTLSTADGSIVLTKPVGAVDGTYPNEWTGEAGNGSWANALNWYCKEAPVKDSKTAVYAFGAADTVTSTDYDIAGAYLKQLVFRRSAISSFTVTSAGERTFFTYGYGANSSVYSESALPQYVSMKFRVTGNNTFSFTANDGPIILTGNVSYPSTTSKFQVTGDIRVSGALKWPQVTALAPTYKNSPITSLTILPGGSFTVTNQTSSLGQTGCAFYVQKNGTLTFLRGDSSSAYYWSGNVTPTKSIVDGTMSIGVPFRGGCNQAFGGSGLLRLADTDPGTKASALTLSESLTTAVSDDWTTTKAGADYPLTLKVASFSSPTLKLSADWTYGPSADAEPASEAADRALVVERESVLTVDAGGFAATFADPVKGEGTLAVTNGTVKLSGGAADLAKVRLEVTGTLEAEEGLSLGAIVSAGGTVRFADHEPIALSDTADVTGLKFEFADGVPRRWATLLTAPSISGAVASSDDYKTRIVETDGGYALQCRMISGALLIIR